MGFVVLSVCGLLAVWVGFGRLFLFLRGLIVLYLQRDWNVLRSFGFRWLCVGLLVCGRCLCGIGCLILVFLG